MKRIIIVSLIGFLIGQLLFSIFHVSVDNLITAPYIIGVLVGVIVGFYSK